MSDSEDKSPHRRSKITEKPSEDSSSKPPSNIPEDSSAKTAEEDASKDKPVEGPTPCSYGGARPKVFLEKKEKKSHPKRGKTDKPSCSYAGARPKVYSEKKDETKKSSNVERAVEMLESTLRKQEKLVRRRREEVEKESVPEHLDLGWIDAETTERAKRPASQQLKRLCRNNLTSGYYRRQSKIPVRSCHDTPTIQTLSDEAVGGKVKDDFKTKSDPDDPPQLIVKLPDLSKKSPKPLQKPKDKGKPIEEPLRKEVYREYNLQSISTHMFLDHPPFVRPGYEREASPLRVFQRLYEIFEQHGVQDWTRFALAAYQTGRYHTEQQLQDARLHLEELQIPEEQFFKNYHEACRNRRADEGYSCETSELVNRIIVLLNSIDEITTAMLYINIWLSRRRRKDSQLRKMYSRVTKNTKMADKDDQETDSSSTEHSDNLRGSDIDEDYDSKSEKPATFFYEAMKDNVTLDIDHRLPLTLDSRPPSVLPSSRSSTPTPPSPVETASPSAEGVSIPDNTSPNSEELQKMQICVLVPKMQVPTEDSTQSSSKPLKLSSDEITDAETLPSTDIGTFPLTESTCIETFPSTEPTDTETFPSTKPTDTETFPSTESIEPLLSTETTHTEPLTLSKSSRIRQLQEIDSPDNTLASLSPLPYDNPPVPELEQDSSKIDMERLHIAIHVAAKGIMENVMNEARVQLAAIPLGNVAEQRDEGIETDNSSQSSERIQPVSDGKRKGDLTDSDEESSGKMSKKRNIE